MSEYLVSTSSLAAYWTFDGNSLDSHNSNDLTRVNSPVFVDGKFSGSLHFDGTQYIHVAENATLDTGLDTPWTIAVWYMSGQGSNASTWLCGKTNSHTAPRRCVYGISLTSNGSEAQARVGNNVDDGSSGTVGLDYGKWQLIIGWHDIDRDEICIQVDNGAIQSSSYSHGTYNNAYDFTIGTAGTITSYMISGSVDEFALWVGRSLSADERNQLWNSGSGLLYPFTGSSGTTTTTTTPAPPYGGYYNIRIRGVGGFPVRIGHVSKGFPVKITKI